MNNKGFTLTELLASIAILAVISTIAAFSYTKVMKDNKIKQCEQKILFIEKQAVKYASDNAYLHDGDKSVTIATLKSDGYLINDDDTDDTINPLTENEFSGEVNLTKENGLISAEYVGDKCE